jgi:hypothetical protein
MTPVPLNIALPGTEGKKKARNMSTPPSDPVIGRAWPLTIALDGGTTNTRARLMQGGRIVATARCGVGVRDAVVCDRSSGPSLADTVRAVIAEVTGAVDAGGRERLHRRALI